MKTTKASKAQPKEEPVKSKVGRPRGRSPGRSQQSPETKTTTRSKSPARKSPARKSPARKSPARKTPLKKSPARKSPSRAAKDTKTEDTHDAPFVLIGNNDIIKNDNFGYEIDTQKLIDSKNGIDVSNIRTGIRERKPRFAETYTMSRQRTTTRTKDYEDLLHIVQNTPLPKNDFSFEEKKNSDPFADDIIPRRLITPIREVKKPYFEFGGTLGVSAIMLFSLFVLGVNMSCSKQPCTFTKLPNLSRYANIGNWVSLRSLAIVTSYLLLQIVLSLVPYFGKKTVLPNGKHTFVANSIFSLIVIECIMLAVQVFYAPITQIIYDDFIQLSIVSFLYGLALAIALFIKGGKTPLEQRNPYGNTGNAIYDFYMGREINPVFLGIVHVKVLLFRIAVFGVILINLVWLCRGTTITNFPALTNETIWNIETYAQIARSVTISPTLLLFCGMQIIYLFDSLCFESSQVTTFEFLYEGVGFLMGTGYFIYAFVPTIFTKRILEQNFALPNYVLIGTFILFLIGFYIYRASNSQKNIFRQNPLDPRISHLETIPTMQGKRLLISGWWGFVRHPNYLGDLMMQTAWAIGTYNALPLYFTIVTYFILLNRIQRDGARCSERYGVAWARYCKRVPYCLVPRVY